MDVNEQVAALSVKDVKEEVDEVPMPAGATVASLGKTLLDEKEPIAKRTRCVFLIKQLGGKEAIETLAKALYSPSVLLGHEVAYVMGQMQDTLAVPFLTSALEDTKLDPVVRHEAAEALAAISKEGSLEVLSRFLDDEAQEVRETCQLSIERIKWNMENDNGEARPDSKFQTVDPAPVEDKVKSVADLEKILVDPSISLFKRYKAMFALRNNGCEEAVLALAKGFDDSSALFRHEIAYVMGQISHVASVPALSKVLKDQAEHVMVRHEAAEALGSIAHEDVADLLESFRGEETDRIVRESCDVALDIVDYWNSDEMSSALPEGQKAQ